MKKASKSDVVVVVGAGSVGQACSRRISAGKLVNSGLVGRNGFMESQISTVQERLKESFDANTDMDLINQPLLMLAGSKADALHMTERALDNATDARNKDCFLSKARRISGHVGSNRMRIRRQTN